MHPSIVKRTTGIALLLAALLATGCPKQPAPETVIPPAAPEAGASGATTDSGAAAPTAIREEPIGETPVVPVAPVVVAKSASQLVAELTRVNFDYDQYLLSPQAQQTLAANAMVLKANPNLKVRIEGHCDERGSDQYNIALGERRAQATKSYLITLGVGAGQLGTVSFGEEKPLDPGHSDEAWAKNRRAEFVPAP